jgi:DNA-binding LacI/PurR family transcriptional regulator
MVKLSDVAAAANVSTKTASRAFNGRPNVSEDVRDRIFFMAGALGYERKPPAAPSGKSGPDRRLPDNVGIDT